MDTSDFDKSAVTGRSCLKGRTALITGGSGTIGSAAAEALLHDGATVMLLARNRAQLQTVRDALLSAVPAGRVELFIGDGCDEDCVAAGMQAAFALQDRLDIIVATVGQGQFRSLLDHDADSFRAALERNIISAFLAIRHGALLMAQGGSIVCISSTVALRPSRGMSAYGTAKAGLEGLVRAAAEELADRGIRINAVRPGPVRSLLRAAMFDDPETSGRFLDQIPLGRLGCGEDIGEAVRYLASPQAGWVTGQSFAVDGGSELRRQPDIANLVGSDI